ncbi:MAG: zf-HC2 domain-containing protein [Gammaproteobacteria bacterium]|nr:zf-HC2 domain-containing protein [Gammaproteobacteria bacterium]
MLKCRELVEQASDYVDDRLDKPQRWAIRLHLLMCAHCRRFMHQFSLAQAVFRALPEPSSEAEELALAERLCEEYRRATQPPRKPDEPS